MVKELNPEAMKLIAELLGTFMPPGWGFTLITFETNTEAAKYLYISSAQRESMKQSLQAVLDKWNGTDELLTVNPN